MAKLAIKGHANRGQEVIQLLEMLGGVNKHQIDAIRETYVYFVDIDGIIRLLQISLLRPEQYIVYSLEEFEKKFPYKVGDKVTLYKFPCIITEMYWEYDDVIYYVKGTDFSKGVYSTDKDLQPYKEEIMETIKIDIPKGYEFAQIDNDKQQIVFTKIQQQYPNTYDECCEVLSLGEDGRLYTKGYKASLIQDFQQLYICRDAYWKIAGEEMGLDKPWKPDWSISGDIKYVIEVYRNKVRTNSQGYSNTILSFPTPEMRNAFYENFKDLIEQCKELL